MKIINYFKNFFYQPMFMLFSASIIILISFVMLSILVLSTIVKMVFGITNAEAGEKLVKLKAKIDGESIDEKA
ncbi:hypothetical protein [Providencia phage PSTRCR_127]|nr:hypothetical protein [Providencia phage PSTRCR_127]